MDAFPGSEDEPVRFSDFGEEKVELWAGSSRLESKSRMDTIGFYGLFVCIQVLPRSALYENSWHTRQQASLFSSCHSPARNLRHYIFTPTYRLHLGRDRNTSLSLGFSIYTFVYSERAFLTYPTTSFTSHRKRCIPTFVSALDGLHHSHVQWGTIGIILIPELASRGVVPAFSIPCFSDYIWREDITLPVTRALRFAITTSVTLSHGFPPPQGGIAVKIIDHGDRCLTLPILL
ncbi:hypothetical protein BDN70DRAFT_937430 [Pholiota conissans]|uniref:Uncharacterized protein n=1 Tax=Pholiota conissans TaxID=109636 RepID=A0A9P5YQA7_9AGAR|nr:hypothetical protein BDN70DRAFT_937430 [Pholiota conissans]